MQQERTRAFLGLLVVLAVIAGFGALFSGFRVTQSIDRERHAVTSRERETAAIDVALSDLKAAQHAYFAPQPQARELWMRRGADLLARLETMLAGVRDAAAEAGARRRYEAALAAVAGLADTDSRAREQLANAQADLAADLIFTDSVDGTQQIRGELGEGQAVETREAEARIAGLHQLGLGVTGGALGLLVVLVLLAGRTTRPAPASPASLTAQMIRELPPPVKTAPAPAPPQPAPIKPAAPAPASSVNLGEAAELCVDLARVIDSRDVPALLQRAADLLEAKGVILWAPDVDETTLRPSLTHGYSARVVARLGTLPVSADNVTSLCFRTMRPQVMPGAPESSGAIAVPLITPNGCAGVLSAEVRDARPSQDLVAVARIIAAQLAVLAGPTEVSDARSAAQA
ncbi:MAG: hypothetical protein IT184_05370 [Acidobacteria bacterium]|nr:hypothetical protein [Acidobacteriota bacterium]